MFIVYTSYIVKMFHLYKKYLFSKMFDNFSTMVLLNSRTRKFGYLIKNIYTHPLYNGNTNSTASHAGNEITQGFH